MENVTNVWEKVKRPGTPVACAKLEPLFKFTIICSYFIAMVLRSNQETILKIWWFPKNIYTSGLLISTLYAIHTMPANTKYVYIHSHNLYIIWNQE